MSTTMSLHIIDTLQFARRMQKAGLDQKVAEELAEAIKETQTQSVEGLATKYDLKMLEQATKQDIKMLEQTTKQNLEILKKDIIIKLGSLIAVSVAILAALIKL